MAELFQELQDQSARDRFENELDVNFCVSAGAGVGKTTAIVLRIVQTALRHPERLSSLVVVTYGVAAADELKSRARTAILDALATKPERVREVLQEFSKAFFGTIHSFCLQLIREFGHVAGLSAESTLMDDAGRERMWRRFVHSEEIELSGGAGGVLQQVMRFVSLDGLYAFAAKLDLQEVDRAMQSQLPLQPPALNCTAALELTSTRAKSLPKEQAALAGWLEAYESGVPYCSVYAASSGGEAYKTATAAALEPLHEWLGAAVLHVAAHWAAAFRDKRVEAAQLTYDDMIYFSNRLLENASVMERLHLRKYRVILDEAQDTDATMFDTLMRITSAAGQPWPSPGHFSFVGDDQQAIFQSRASVDQYLTMLEGFAGSGAAARLDLSVTMRCPVRVVDAVNTVFSKQDLQAGCVKFREVIARPAAPDGGIFSFALPESEGKAGINEVFELEAGAIVALLASRGPQGFGVSQWNEIAILGARNQWLRTLKAALGRAGIPAIQLGGGEKLRHQPGATWPAALLHVLLHPDDSFELLGVLREIFVVSDRDLVRFTASLGAAIQLSSTHRGCPADLRLALDTLIVARDICRAADADHLYSMVTGVFEKVQLRDRLAAAFPVQLTFFDEVVRCAREASVDGMSLQDFTNGLMERLDTEVVEASAGKNAVQLLSCHRSKGLQWPVVVLPGLWREPRSASPSYPCISRSAGCTHVAAVKGGRSGEVVASLKSAADEELLRLLYVAMTRAQQLLVLPGVVAPPQSPVKSAFSMLAKFHDINWQPLLLEESASLPLPPASPAIEHAPFEFQPSLDAQNISMQVPARILPHALVHDPDPVVLPEDSDTEFSVPVGGVEYGTWWHSAMERVDWMAWVDLIGASLKNMLAELPAASLDRARASLEVDTLMASGLPELIRTGTSTHFEVPFLHPFSADEWREGVIDLVVVQADGSLWILDWKTNRCPTGMSVDEHHAALSMRYRPQLQAYSAAIEGVAGLRVSRMSLFATATGALIDV